MWSSGVKLCSVHLEVGKMDKKRIQRLRQECAEKAGDLIVEIKRHSSSKQALEAFDDCYAFFAKSYALAQ